MVRKVTMMLLAVLLPAVIVKAQAPMGFNYQAAIYVAGQPVKNTKVELTLKLVDEAGSADHSEDFAVTTDGAGFVSVVIGEKGFGDAVNFGKGYWVDATVKFNGQSYPLGKVKLQAVPYALHASAGMTIREPEGWPADKPLFQVLNKKGEPVYEVYNDGTRIYVTDDGVRGPRGGFAVYSRNGDQTVERMSVGSGVAFTVDDGTRGPRGGFAVMNRVQSASGSGQMQEAPRLMVGNGGVNIFVEESSQTRAGGPRGGFAVNLQRYDNLRGENITGIFSSEPLMVMDQNRSFVAIGSQDCQGAEVNPFFSILNRCDGLKPVFSVNSEGQVAANITEIDSIPLRPAQLATNYTIDSGSTINRYLRYAVPSITYDGLQLTTGYRIADINYISYLGGPATNVPANTLEIYEVKTSDTSSRVGVRLTDEGYQFLERLGQGEGYSAQITLIAEFGEVIGTWYVNLNNRPLDNPSAPYLGIEPMAGYSPDTKQYQFAVLLEEDLKLNYLNEPDNFKLDITVANEPNPAPVLERVEDWGVLSLVYHVQLQREPDNAYATTLRIDYIDLRVGSDVLLTVDQQLN